MGPTARTRAALALLVGVAAISWSAIFVRWTHMPGVSSAFYRLLIAAVALWLILLLRRRALTGFAPRTALLACLGGLFFAADLGCYNVAVLRTAAGTATFLGNNAPVAVALFAWFFTRKKPSSRFWTALAVATAGAILIVFKDFRHDYAASLGDLLAIAASVSFALYLVVTERLRDTVDTVALIALSTSASAVALFTFALLSHTSLAVPTASAGAALLGLGIICQLTGYFCLTYALGHLPATVSSVVLLAVAPLTAMLAFLFFGERMTSLQLLGGALILAAVWLVTSSSRVRHLAVAEPTAF